MISLTIVRVDEQCSQVRFENVFKAHLAALLIYCDAWYLFGDIAPVFDVAQARGLKMNSDLAAFLSRCLVFPYLEPCLTRNVNFGALFDVGKMHMWYEHPSQGHVVQKTLTDETNFSDLVMHYTEWLAADAERTASHSSEDIRKYTNESLNPVTFNGAETRTFAPFRQILSARQTLTSGQSRFLLAFGLLWLLGLILFGVQILVITFAGIIVFYLSALLVNFILSTKALARSPEEQISDEVVKALVDARWPRYTVLCPLYREAAIAPQFVQAMQALDYPTDKLEILLLTEEDDVETCQALQELHLPSHFSIITVPPGKPRTKPRACNFGLL